MTRISILRLAKSSFLVFTICAQAFAQDSQGSCASLAGYQYHDSLDRDAFRVSVSTDIRGRAGFTPAFVVTLTVPPSPVIADFSGEANIAAQGYLASLRPTRAEYWLMSQHPRAANPAPALPEFNSRDADGNTLYFLFYKVPEEAMLRT